MRTTEDLVKDYKTQARSSQLNVRDLLQQQLKGRLDILNKWIGSAKDNRKELNFIQHDLRKMKVSGQCTHLFYEILVHEIETIEDEIKKIEEVII